MKAGEIVFKRGIMHVLGSDTQTLILSDQEINLTPEINEFLCSHIEKVTEGDDCRRNCKFDEASKMLPVISGACDENFIEVSKEVAKRLYEIMEISEIPAADIFVLVFTCHETDYFAMLKMNYRSSYTHSAQDSGVRLVQQRTLLPGASTRIGEAFFVNLTDGSITLCDRAYEINGRKTNYLASLLLECHAPLSQKAKLDIVSRAADQIVKKHYGDEDPTRKMEVKKAILTELEKPQGMKVREVPERIFPNSPAMQEELTEKLKETRMEEEVIEPNSPVTVKKFKTQRLITDSGIEIRIPIEETENSDHIEIVTNPDGSRNLIIKNIAALTAK